MKDEDKRMWSEIMDMERLIAALSYHDTTETTFTSIRVVE